MNIIEGNHGAEVTDSAKINDADAEFCKNLYENFFDVAVVNQEGTNDLLLYVNTILGHEQWMVVNEITLGDLKAMLDTCSDSSLGPDVTTYGFLQKLGNTFGPVTAQLHSLATGTRIIIDGASLNGGQITDNACAMLSGICISNQENNIDGPRNKKQSILKLIPHSETFINKPTGDQ